MPLSTGDRLGPYEILAPLGAGGMGEVYRARDTRLEREVAIKVSKAEFSERFEREARAVAALNHPHICQLYDVGPNYLVMEFVEGTPLKGPLPVDKALEYAAQILDALDAAHRKAITHRDLKPANILVTKQGIKLLDFGLAKLGNAPLKETDETLTQALTSTGQIVGTLQYMSPEQLQAKEVDARSDLFSFGCVLYEMLTGKRAFGGGSAASIIAAILERPAPSVADVAPPALDRLIQTCLAKDPDQRIQTARDVAIAISWVALPQVVPATSKPSRKWPFALAALVVALAFVGGRALSPSGPQTEIHWTGVRLGGSTVALGPRISPDGQLLAFQAMVDGLTQVAVMKQESGNWVVLTDDRSRGLAEGICWSRDGTKLYFGRMQGGPRGVFSVPALGGDERLVLEDAGSPQMLPDGSLLVGRLNSERRSQLHRFWPESGRVQPLKVLLSGGPAATFRVTPRGDRVIFLGTPLDSPSAPHYLYAMDLSSEKILRLAPQVSVQPMAPLALAVAADGRSVFFNLASGDSPSVVSVPSDGSKGLRTLFPLSAVAGNLDVGSDGSLYADRWERPADVLRFSPSGGTVEHIGEATGTGTALALPLPDGRVVYSSRTANREHLLVAGSGKEPTALVQTDEDTATPSAVVAQTQVAFLIGHEPNRTIALASITDGRVMRRLNGSKGAAISSMASSPDGKTIYYTASGSVWAIPVSDGQPQKLRSGDAVTVDASRQEFIVRLGEKDGARLVRAPMAGGPERAIPIEGGARVATDGTLSPTAVGRDGRILTQVALGSSWFWPAGLLDPLTGRVQIPRIGYDADMLSPGWTRDGKVVVIAEPLRSSLWRFRPEAEKQ